MKRFYTTIEQSKKLLELGLSPDTADMSYPYGQEYPIVKHGNEFFNEEKFNIFSLYFPCWSLQALIEIASKEDLHKISLLHRGYEGDEYEADWFCCFEDRKETFGDMETKTAPAPIEAAYAMVCWLLEKGHIKKG